MSKEDELIMSIPVCILFDKGIWMEYCRVTGTSEWVVNVGMLNDDDNVQLTIKQAKEIGLI